MTRTPPAPDSVIGVRETSSVLMRSTSWRAGEALSGLTTADQRHRRVGHGRAGDDGGWAPEPPLGPSPDRHQVPGPASIRAPPVATSRASVDILPAVRPAQLSRPSRVGQAVGCTEPTNPGSPGVTAARWARLSEPWRSSRATSHSAGDASVAEGIVRSAVFRMAKAIVRLDSDNAPFAWQQRANARAALDGSVM